MKKIVCLSLVLSALVGSDVWGTSWGASSCEGIPADLGDDEIVAENYTYIKKADKIYKLSFPDKYKLLLCSGKLWIEIGSNNPGKLWKYDLTNGWALNPSATASRQTMPIPRPTTKCDASLAGKINMGATGSYFACIDTSVNVWEWVLETDSRVTEAWIKNETGNIYTKKATTPPPAASSLPSAIRLGETCDSVDLGTIARDSTNTTVVCIKEEENQYWVTEQGAKEADWEKLSGATKYTKKATTPPPAANSKSSSATKEPCTSLEMGVVKVKKLASNPADTEQFCKPNDNDDLRKGGSWSDISQKNDFIREMKLKIDTYISSKALLLSKTPTTTPAKINHENKVSTLIDKILDAYFSIRFDDTEVLNQMIKIRGEKIQLLTEYQDIYSPDERRGRRAQISLLNHEIGLDKLEITSRSKGETAEERAAKIQAILKRDIILLDQKIEESNGIEKLTQTSEKIRMMITLKKYKEEKKRETLEKEIYNLCRAQIEALNAELINLNKDRSTHASMINQFENDIALFKEEVRVYELHQKLQRDVASVKALLPENATDAESFAALLAEQNSVHDPITQTGALFNCQFTLKPEAAALKFSWKNDNTNNGTLCSNGAFPFKKDWNVFSDFGQGAALKSLSTGHSERLGLKEFLENLKFDVTHRRGVDGKLGEARSGTNVRKGFLGRTIVKSLTWKELKPVKTSSQGFGFDCLNGLDCGGESPETFKKKLENCSMGSLVRSLCINKAIHSDWVKYMIRNYHMNVAINTLSNQKSRAGSIDDDGLSVSSAETSRYSLNSGSSRNSFSSVSSLDSQYDESSVRKLTKENRFFGKNNANRLREDLVYSMLLQQSLKRHDAYRAYGSEAIRTEMVLEESEEGTNLRKTILALKSVGEPKAIKAALEHFVQKAIAAK